MCSTRRSGRGSPHGSLRHRPARSERSPWTARRCGARAAATPSPRMCRRAADQQSGVVLASTDVDGKTNEITRFAPLLDQIGDLRGVVVTADALHCQREHVVYLAERGAHWI